MAVFQKDQRCCLLYIFSDKELWCIMVADVYVDLRTRGVTSKMVSYPGEQYDLGVDLLMHLIA